MRLRYRSIAVGGVPLRSPGHGAPIEARLIVRGGLLMIRPKDRGLAVVRIAVKVGGLLDGLSPPRNGKRRIVENRSKDRGGATPVEHPKLRVGALLGCPGARPKQHLYRFHAELLHGGVFLHGEQAQALVHPRIEAEQ